MRRFLFVTCLASAICLATLASSPARAYSQVQAMAATLNNNEFSPRVAQLIKNNDAAEAVALADIGLQRNPKNTQLRFLRAVALDALGRTDEAEKALRALIDQFPEIPEPYNNLAVIEASKGNLDEALSLLKKALTLSPNFALAQKNVGDVYLSMALDEYEKAGPQLKHNEQLQQRIETIRELLGRS